MSWIKNLSALVVATKKPHLLGGVLNISLVNIDVTTAMKNLLLKISK